MRGLLLPPASAERRRPSPAPRSSGLPRSRPYIPDLPDADLEADLRDERERLGAERRFERELEGRA